ncbi:topoisomerase [Bacillus toyonensis]|nr:topoisomerase [Bacillus toyonensis]PKR93962.1 RRNA adenine dimethylase [Bacillus cereus Rock4-18]PEJ66751.1 topoisomerase [Bacillus toyonensis]PEL55458.1 topoisomerase [Bacillus toyonensis]PEM83123.1 topoisomerase [Bacillus toyonensis]
MISYWLNEFGTIIGMSFIISLIIFWISSFVNKMIKFK